ncbi:hypothetical protein BDZ89DRAFT_1064174 [Hymenopellis radicata]|nr:hypothetical protein BDZ89DRAFT_1064174 [Hymenopellis radicata]
MNKFRAPDSLSRGGVEKREQERDARALKQRFSVQKPPLHASWALSCHRDRHPMSLESMTSTLSRAKSAGTTSILRRESG